MFTVDHKYKAPEPTYMSRTTACLLHDAER
jgi:hypothetical protein